MVGYVSYVIGAFFFNVNTAMGYVEDLTPQQVTQRCLDLSRDLSAAAAAVTKRYLSAAAAAVTRRYLSAAAAVH